MKLQMKKWLRGPSSFYKNESLVKFFFLLGLCFFSDGVLARGKLDVSVGFFSLQATTARGTSTVSSLGSYQLAYRTPVFVKVELLVGYSMIMSKIYTGDLGFGPDLGVVYFPFTAAYPLEAKSENVTFRTSELYKPYVGSAFHQRQYQSSQSTYAGFSGFVGSEYYLMDKVSLKGELRFIKLTGPSQGTATEMDVLFGTSILF
jgi:hypothetical protein